jgi:hypothetical protein
MDSSEELEQVLTEILDGDKSELMDLREEFDTVHNQGGVRIIAHLYGLNMRERQFEEMYQAYREFYRFKDFRDTERKQQKLENLMEAYRNYFGSGSNETWNEGVETALSAPYLLESKDGPISRSTFKDILAGEDYP